MRPFRLPFALILAPILALALLAACGGGGGGGGDEDEGGPVEDPGPPRNQAPSVVIDFPFPDVVVSQDRVHLRGTATDADGVASISVRVNGVLVDADQVVGTTAWRATARLEDGANRIDVGAEDGLGNRDTAATTIRVERMRHLPEDLRGAHHDAANDRVLVVDHARRALLELRLSDGSWRIVSGIIRGTGPPFAGPVEVTVAPGRNTAYVADRRQILAVDLATGNRTLISAHVTGPSGGRGVGLDLEELVSVAWDETNERLFALEGLLLGTLFEIDLATGDRIPRSYLFVGDGPRFDDPTDLAVSADGSAVYVTDLSRGILMVDPATGDRTVLQRSDGMGPLAVGVPTAITIVGNLAYVLTLGGRQLREVDLVTRAVRRVAEPLEFTDGVIAQGSDVVFDTARGEALVVDGTPLGRAGVLAIDPTDDSLSATYGVSRGRGEVLVEPSDIAFDPARNRLLVTDAERNSVVAVDARTGDRTTLSRSDDGQPDRMVDANAISVDAARDVAYVGSVGGRAVVALDLATRARSPVTNAARGTGPELDELVDLCSDDAGSLFLAELDGNVFLHVDVSTGDRSRLGPTDHPFAHVGRCEARTLTDSMLGVEGDYDVGVPPWVVDIEQGTGRWTPVFDRSGLEPDDLAYDTLRDVVLLVGQTFLAAQDPDSGAYEPIGDGDIGRGPLPQGVCRLALDAERSLLYVLRMDDARILVVDLVSLDRIYLSR